jgi:hypothetical protein
MAERLGYVIVTRISGCTPFIECSDILADLGDAREQRAEMDSGWNEAGRPSRFAVAEVLELEDDDA